MVKDTRAFKTQTLAVEFLEGEGFKVNTSTLSRHVRSGLVGTNSEGFFEAEALLAYASLHLKRKESGKTLTEEDKARMDAMTAAQLNLLEAKAARERIKQRREEGNIVPLETYRNDLAARMAFFSLQLDGFAVQQAEAAVDVIVGKRLEGVAQVIEVVGGDAGKARELAAWMERKVPELAEVYLVRKQQWLKAFAEERVHIVEMEPAEFEEDDDVED